MKPGKPNPLLEIAVTIAAPAAVLMLCSDAAHLGALRALLLALAFPLLWGAWDAWRRRRLNALAVLGVASALLTGGIGVLELDARWLAVKEAAVPGAIAVAVLVSTWTRRPLVRVLVFNAELFDVERVHAALEARRAAPAFERRLRTATLLLAGTFVFTAAASYGLTRWVVTSPAGSEAFNTELGRLTLLSYTLVALPAMAMMMALLLWLARGAKALTGLGLADMLRG